MSRTLRTCLLLAFTVLGGLRHAAATAEDTPTAVVQSTADRVVGVLADPGMPAAQKREKIEKIVSEYFDFTTLSKLVLGRNWKALSSDQQTQFVEEFRHHLSLTYGKNVEDYHNEKAVIAGDRKEPDGDWTVKTRIERPNAQPILVDYRLRRMSDKWMVIDVIIEGTSLVANFRSQFQDIVSREGTARLIDVLRQKNARGEALNS